jgi:hypothetical protein
LYLQYHYINQFVLNRELHYSAIAPCCMAKCYQLISLRAQITYDGHERRLPRHTHSELRILSNQNLRHRRSKAHKIYVLLPFFLLQSYAYAYKIEYLISKVAHFIQMEASENCYLSLVLWNLKPSKFARNKMCNCKICIITFLVSPK